MTVSNTESARTVSQPGTGSRWSHGGWGIPVAAASAILYAAAFPPIGLAEAAYVFAIPFILWAYTRPAWLAFAASAFAANVVAWIFLLIWLRHVPAAAGMSFSLIIGLGLVLLLAGITALFGTGWLLAVRWVVPRMSGRSFHDRLPACLALAGLWVLFEWSRTWFLSGFPWLPLSASQWERPVILQAAAWTGAYGISFLLILMNLGIAAYLRLIFTVRKFRRWTDRFCPEFYLALGLLMAGVTIFFQTLPRDGQMVPIFEAGMVQPAIPQTLKWDSEEVERNLQTLEHQTRLINHLEPDILFWPEASTPHPIIGPYNVRMRVENLVRELDTPLILGSLAQTQDGSWHNGIFAVTPEAGLQSRYYAKRKLVPFGEYVPLGRILPFIGRFVPLEGEFVRGQGATLIPIRIRNRSWRVGGLVCYEDAFPRLARSLTANGAEVLFVATNNAWYGEEAAAFQHAAHSVLRAVENRRPVLRTGNDGWSGYIDERGQIRHILFDARGSIYFRGGSTMQVFRDRILAREPSFYTRYGDWFVLFSALLCGIAFQILRHEPRKPSGFLEPEDESPGYRPLRARFRRRE